MSDEEWMREHKGPYIDTIAEVWWCMDDDCGCTQPRIVKRYANLKAPGFVVPVVVWQGTFRTDHEPGADEELAAHRAELERTDPDFASRITWPRLETPQ